MKISTRPEQSAADVMPAANAATSKRQMQQAKELAAKEAAADARERRKAAFGPRLGAGVKKGDQRGEWIVKRSL